MARLRLFANLREAAGSGSVDIDGATVGEVLARSSDRFGPQFAAGLDSAQVWVNGEPAEPNTPVRPSDEVAVIPPVSGGEAVPGTPPLYRLALGAALVAAVLIADFASLQIFTFVVVGSAVAWAWDVAETNAQRNAEFDPYPPIIGVAAAPLGVYAGGFSGFAIGAVIGILAVLVSAIARPEHRSIQSVAATSLTTVVGALGAGALVAVRMRTVEEVVVLLVIVVVAGASAWAMGRFADAVPGVDPNLGILIGALVAGILSGIVVERLTMGVAIVAAALTAAGLIAGRTFGSLIRTGRLNASPGPGSLAQLDGAVLGSALFWVALVLLS